MRRTSMFPTMTVEEHVSSRSVLVGLLRDHGDSAAI